MTSGILILHGFAGSPKDIAMLGDHLSQCGYTVSAPVLAGHDASRKALADAKPPDWIASAEQAAAELRNTCSDIILIGFSMGGLIAVNLCQRLAIHKMVTINTPIFYWNCWQIIKNLARDFFHYGRIYLAAAVEKPFAALLSFLKLLHMSKPLFASVHCPALILQTMDDDTVHHKSADFIFRHVQGEKKLIKLQNGGHLVFYTEEGLRVCAAVEAFVRSQPGGAQGSVGGDAQGGAAGGAQGGVAGGAQDSAYF